MNFFEKYQYLLDTWKINLLLPYTYQKLAWYLIPNLGLVWKCLKNTWYQYLSSTRKKTWLLAYAYQKLTLDSILDPKLVWFFFKRTWYQYLPPIWENKIWIPRPITNFQNLTPILCSLFEPSTYLLECPISLRI